MHAAVAVAVVVFKIGFVSLPVRAMVVDFFGAFFVVEVFKGKKELVVVNERNRYIY